MSAKATSSKTASTKTAPPKPAKAKAAKSPAAKQPVAKQAAAPKAVKAPAKGKVKSVKAPARAKNQPTGVHLQIADVEPDLEVYYVTLDPLPPQIHSAMPGSGVQAVEFSSFAEVRERAIDQLIELIEEAERRLHLLRRAGSREEYPH